MRSGVRMRQAHRAAAAHVESLELRTLMSVTPSFSLVHDPMSLDAPGRGRAHILVPAPGGNLEAASASTDTSTSEGSATTTSSSSASRFDVKIVAGSGLAADAAALAAFERAAAQWEARITDPITVTINADLSNLGNTSTIGQTSSVQIEDAFGVVRDAMVADAADEPDDAIVAALPSSGSFVLPNNRFKYGGTLAGSKAAIKALGFTGLDAQFGAKDADITFNSQFAFDYDNRDGVTGGRMDFETVAAHEIGHALGFSSMVDSVDYYARYNLGITVPASTLDLFRFENNVSGRDPQTAAEFTSFPRSLRPNVDAVTDGLAGWDDGAGGAAAAENRMSTGYYTGDGRQASHWKDNDLTGVTIGIHDPTLGTGQAWGISAADWRALDLIGWDIGPTTGTPNAAPDAVDDAFTTDEDTVLGVAAPGVLSNDKDADGDALRAVALSGPSSLGAAVTVNADGSFTYDPRLARPLQELAAGDAATDTFTYSVTDGRGGTDTAAITVTVTGADEAPGSELPGNGLKVAFFSGSVMPSSVGDEQLDPDGVVAEDWGVTSPAGMPSDNFTARWRGQMLAPASGDFTFYAKVDDNVRLWIDDASNPGDTPQLVIRRWGTANTSEFKSTPVTLEQGRRYNIQMDFREMTGGASAFLRYGSAGAGVAKQVIPKANLYSHAPGSEPAVLVDPYLADKNKRNDDTIVGIDNGNGSSDLTIARPAAAAVARASGATFSATAIGDEAAETDAVAELLA